jgi:sec-independent protein translocase protein TatB
MFDFAWSELALIAVVALVVIGPKDLPRVMRMVGTWVRKARAIAHEFQGSLEQMVRDSELDEVKNQVDKATRFDFEEEFKQTVDPGGELSRSLSEPVLTNPLAEEATPKPAELPAPETPAAAPDKEPAAAQDKAPATPGSQTPTAA